MNSIRMFSRTQKIYQVKQLRRILDEKRSQLRDEQMKFVREQRIKEQKQEIHDYEIENLIEDQLKLLRETQKAADQCHSLFIETMQQKNMSKQTIDVTIVEQNSAIEENKRERPVDNQQDQDISESLNIVNKKIKNNEDHNDNNQQEPSRQNHLNQKIPQNVNDESPSEQISSKDWIQPIGGQNQQIEKFQQQKIANQQNEVSQSQFDEKAAKQFILNQLQEQRKILRQRQLQAQRQILIQSQIEENRQILRQRQIDEKRQFDHRQVLRREKNQQRNQKKNRYFYQEPQNMFLSDSDDGLLFGRQAKKINSKYPNKVDNHEQLSEYIADNDKEYWQQSQSQVIQQSESLHNLQNHREQPFVYIDNTQINPHSAPQSPSLSSQQSIESYQPQIDPVIDPLQYNQSLLQSNQHYPQPPSSPQPQNQDQDQNKYIQQQGYPSLKMDDIEDYQKAVKQDNPPQQQIQIDQDFLYLEYPDDLPNHPKEYVEDLHSKQEIYYRLDSQTMPGVFKSSKIIVPYNAFYLDHNHIPVQMDKFIKYDWSNLIGIKFVRSQLTDQKFKKFVDNSHLYSLIKILYLSFNPNLTVITCKMLQKFKRMQYLFLGDRPGSCHLNQDSIKEIKKYQSLHRQVNIIYYKLQQ